MDEMDWLVDWLGLALAASLGWARGSIGFSGPGIRRRDSEREGVALFSVWWNAGWLTQRVFVDCSG